MNVSGTLSAIGNQTQNILMTGTGKNYSGEWRGRIAFQNTSSNSVISYAQITSTPDTIIGIYSSSTTISNSIIGGTNGNATYINASSPTLIGNVISGNGANGIYIDGNAVATGSPTITANTISNNTGSGIIISRGSPTISGNSITDNNCGINDQTSRYGDSPNILGNTLSNNSCGIFWSSIPCMVTAILFQETSSPTALMESKFPY